LGPFSFKFNSLTFVEGLVTVHRDGEKCRKHLLRLTLDDPKPFEALNHLTVLVPSLANLTRATPMPELTILELRGVSGPFLVTVEVVLAEPRASQKESHEHKR